MCKQVSTPSSTPTAKAKPTEVETKDTEPNSKDWERNLDISTLLKMNRLSINCVKHLKEKVNWVAPKFTLLQAIEYATEEIEQEIVRLENDDASIVSAQPPRPTNIYSTIKIVTTIDEESPVADATPARIPNVTATEDGKTPSQNSNEINNKDLAEPLNPVPTVMISGGGGDRGSDPSDDAVNELSSVSGTTASSSQESDQGKLAEALMKSNQIMREEWMLTQEQLKLQQQQQESQRDAILKALLKPKEIGAAFYHKKMLDQ